MSHVKILTRHKKSGPGCERGRFVAKEGVHTPIFKNNMQRLRFLEKLHLSVPTDLIAYCPGGSHTSTFAAVQVKERRNINEILTERGPIILKLRPVV